MPPDSSAPARRVVTRSPAKTVRRLNMPGLFGAAIECESSLERDFVLRAALCPSVRTIRHQPFRLQLGPKKTYVPDFLITTASGRSLVVEVKLSTHVEKFRERFDQAMEELARRDVDFMVITELSIHAGRAHQRAARVLRYRKASIDEAIAGRITTVLEQHPAGISFDALCTSCFAQITDVLTLAAAKRVRLSKTIDLDPPALVYPIQNSGADDEIRLESWFDVALW